MIGGEPRNDLVRVRVRVRARVGVRVRVRVRVRVTGGQPEREGFPCLRWYYFALTYCDYAIPHHHYTLL